MHELDIVKQAGILLCLTCRLVDVVTAVMLSRHVLPSSMSAVETGSHASVRQSVHDGENSSRTVHSLQSTSLTGQAPAAPIGCTCKCSCTHAHTRL